LKMADLPNPHQGFGIGRQPDPRTSIQQIHENFIIELASLSNEAKGQKVRDYIRRTMIYQMISPTELAVQFQIPRETLRRWIRKIRDEVEQPQSSVFGVAQGMVQIPAYPLAAATSAKSVLLGSARRPTPIQVHQDPYSNPLHGYTAAVASAAAGAGSQVINTVHCPSLSAPHEFPYIGRPDFDCRLLCAVPPTAGLPGQRSGV
jgi:hypothetical protein